VKESQFDEVTNIPENHKSLSNGCLLKISLIVDASQPLKYSVQMISTDSSIALKFVAFVPEDHSNTFIQL
jgi:hypothetical protein